jgi:hypothetical protein
MLALAAFNAGTSLLPSQLLPTYIRASDAEIARTLKAQIGNTTI